MTTVEEFVDATAAELAALASERRDALFGRVATFSPKVFIPLTELCRDRCGYCTFAKAPARLAAPYLSIDEVVAIAKRGEAAGCTEALFTLGERPELRYDDAAAWLADHGYDSTVAYLAAACAAVLEATTLLPHANAGALYPDELALVRTVSASQGMMLETLREDLEAHRLAPDKTPARRLGTLDAAGAASIPFTTGLLVGIGEDRGDRLATLAAIASAHERHGHVQEVIVQNFLPKPRTQMADWAPAPLDELRWTIAAARLLLPDDVHVQAPPNLVDDPLSILDAGADDLGGISPVTIDHVNPERSWPQLEGLGDVLGSHGYALTPRLTIYPTFAELPTRWLDVALRTPVLRLCDAQSFGRGDAWVSGGNEPPPAATTHSRAADFGRVAEVLSGIARGQELGEDEIVALFAARGGELAAVCEAADRARRRLRGDDVTFVINRNINYTNVCTFKCRFCAFSKGPLSLNLRGDPYLLDLDEIARRVAEAAELGCTEVCLQGGIHPSFDGDYYLDVLRAVRTGSPDIHIHAFSALEVREGARRSSMSLADYLCALKDAGLKTLPGTAAEILDDEVRKILCPDKLSTDEWLEVHETAHGLGLRSNVTIMFGAVETSRSWAKHLLAARALQRRTGGFTEFVPLPFVHMATPLYLKGAARKGPTFREVLLMHAVGRLVYDGEIDNVQVSWVKLGAEGSRRVLQAGANDLGGTLIDENISRAAGAAHGQRMGVEELAAIVAPLGRTLRQRTTLYAMA